jgi:galactokinase
LGNHTDYNEGVVLSAAIDRYTYAAAKPNPGDTFRFYSAHFDQSVEFSAADSGAANLPSWANYPLGVYRMLKEAGFAVRPFDLSLLGDLPFGAGLSSSASVEVATALALAESYRLDVSDRQRLARLCQKAENRYTGAQCGLLDQFSVLFGRAGHALLIDFRTFEHQAVPLAEHGLSLAIAVSGVTHSLASSAYNDRRADCSRAAAFFAARSPSVKALRDVTVSSLLAAKDELESLAFRRALHIVGECDRVEQGMKHLRRGELDAFGALLYESHESSRINFENSCPELDHLVKIARSVPGVHGSRLTGGGFGGATITLLRQGAEDDFRRTMVKQYKEATGRAVVIHFATATGAAEVLA